MIHMEHKLYRSCISEIRFSKNKKLARLAAYVYHMIYIYTLYLLYVVYDDR